MECQVLDQLVRLAAFGTSGVCILLVFVLGAAVKRGSENPEYNKTLRTFIVSSVFIALFSLVSGITNAYIKQSQLNELDDKNNNLASANKTLRKDLDLAVSTVKAMDEVLSANDRRELFRVNPDLRLRLDSIQQLNINPDVPQRNP